MSHVRVCARAHACVCICMCVCGGGWGVGGGGYSSRMFNRELLSGGVVTTSHACANVVCRCVHSFCILTKELLSGGGVNASSPENVAHMMSVMVDLIIGGVRVCF